MFKGVFHLKEGNSFCDICLFGLNIFTYFIWDIKVMILPEQELFLSSFVINFCFSFLFRLVKWFDNSN